MKKTAKKCESCGNSLVTEASSFESKDVKKLRRIMKKNKLSQNKLSIILGVSQSYVSSWLRENTNPNGKINKKYFEILKKEEYL